jgi:iron uptake system component EfeO
LNHARFALPAAILVATVGLAACGDDSDSSSQAGSYSTTTGQATPTGDAAIDAAVEQYDAYVEENAAALTDATKTFVAAVKAGDLERAKQLYPVTRSFYERIEPVASSFGTLDPEIDAREGDVPDAQFAGFHYIERGLWIDGTTDGLDEVADELLKDVEKLQTVADDGSFGATEIAKGSVDLLGEVSSSKITGEEERYSHTDLWDFEANVEGAEAGFQALGPVIKEKDPELATEISDDFASTYKLLDGYRKGTDGFVLYDTLSKRDTQQLAQQIDALGEAMSQVPAVTG